MSEELWGNSKAESERGAKLSVEQHAMEDQEATAASSKEWRLLERLVLGLNAERRRARRWGIFFKFLTFAYLTALIVLWLPDDLVEPDSQDVPHVALVDLNGTIAADDEAGAETLIAGLRRAFDSTSSKAVILRINSPGGSPVQSGYVYDEIKRLRGLHPDTPIYGVIQDIGASGAYYIAAATDHIYADKASLVGSIGVISSSFGFVELMKKIGVERRAVTAGDHKAFLDPFSPADSAEQAYWQEVLDTTHRQFIEQVRNGRGNRLKETPELFSGLVWTGEQALELGLIDGLGSAGFVAREVVGIDKVVDYTERETFAERLAERLGAQFARSLAAELGFGGSPLK